MRDVGRGWYQNVLQSPQYVVLGYDTEIGFEKLSTASIHLHSEVTHGQLVIQTWPALPLMGVCLIPAYPTSSTTTGVRPTHCGKQSGHDSHRSRWGYYRTTAPWLAVDCTPISRWLRGRGPWYSSSLWRGDNVRCLRSKPKPSLVVDSVASYFEVFFTALV